MLKGKRKLLNKGKRHLYSIDGHKGAKTALITGASSGLGTSFAKVFAREGFNLVLTARRKERLEEVASELESEYGISTTCISADLSKPGAPKEIYDECERQHIDVDVLVNNAGLAIPGFYQETSWEDHEAFLQLMITVPSQMSYLFEPAMVKRGHGRIINVASFVGLITPTGSYTLYGAAKSFLIKFSQAHAEELKGTGVHVLALCPGFFKSELHNESDESIITHNLPERMFLDVEQVAEEGYEVAMKGEDVVYVNGRIYRLMGDLERGAFNKIRGKGSLLSYADRLRRNLNQDGRHNRSGSHG